MKGVADGSGGREDGRRGVDLISTYASAAISTNGPDPFVRIPHGGGLVKFQNPCNQRDFLLLFEAPHHCEQFCSPRLFGPLTTNSDFSHQATFVRHDRGSRSDGDAYSAGPTAVDLKDARGLE